MRKITYLGSLLVFTSVISIPSFAQAPQRQYKGGTPEYDEYLPAYNARTDAAKEPPMAEKFLMDFPNSDYAPDVYQILVGAYFDAQQWPKVLDAAERFENAPAFKSQFVTDKNKIVIYADAACAALSAGNPDKMFTYINKGLAVDPPMTNPATANMLLYVSANYPETTLPTDPAAKDAFLKRALDLAAKADTAVTNLFKTVQVPEAQQKTIKTSLHETFGYIGLLQQDNDKAVTEYETALKEDSKNGVAWYRLGMAYYGQAAKGSKDALDKINELNDAKKNHADQARIDDLDATQQALQVDAKEKQNKAMDALATSVAVGGPAQAAAKAQLDKLWKLTHNDSLDGEDQLINSKKDK